MRGLRGARIGVARTKFFGYSDVTDKLINDAIDTMKATGAVIVDPANNDNNVAARIHPGERDALVASARQAYETITWAQGLPRKGETISAWKELFGSNFSID